jgi:hypothetical protein
MQHKLTMLAHGMWALWGHSSSSETYYIFKERLHYKYVCGWLPQSTTTIK